MTQIFFQLGCNNATVLADYDCVERVLKKCLKNSYEQKSMEKDVITKILTIRIVFAYKRILKAGINECEISQKILRFLIPTYVDDVFAERNRFGHTPEWNFLQSFNANAQNSKRIAIIKTYFIANICHSSLDSQKNGRPRTFFQPAQYTQSELTL